MPLTCIEITPDLARQIVALAGNAIPPPVEVPAGQRSINPILSNDHGVTGTPMGAGTWTAPQPVADDAAVVEAMAYLIDNAPGNTMQSGCAALLAAIRAGKVPGVCGDNDANSLARRLAADLAAEKSANEELHKRLGDLLDAGPVCATCGKPATCIGAYEGSTVDEYACDDCCGHGNEDGHCRPLETKP